MTPPDTATARVGVVLLVVGYPMSIAVLVRLVPVLVERRRRWFAVLVAGTLCVVAGYGYLRRPVPAALNAVCLVGLIVAWVWTGRRRRRRR